MSYVPPMYEEDKDKTQNPFLSLVVLQMAVEYGILLYLIQQLNVNNIKSWL